jgi:hypothetical protein
VFALFDASREAEQSVYITFADGQIYLVTAQALNKELDKQAVARMRQLVEETRTEVAGVNAGVTGESVLELDELEQSQKDTMVASVVALLLSAMIFIYGYHETGRPLKATACLIVGVGYTMGFATLVIGHLNILTITFVPILIGLAIDFGVHLVTRYEEELRHGKTEDEAITKALVFTGQGIFTGAFTTAGAFLAMGFTDFRGIQEMGIICGGGLLVCLIPMLTMLPALLLRGLMPPVVGAGGAEGVGVPPVLPPLVVLRLMLSVKLLAVPAVPVAFAFVYGVSLMVCVPVGSGQATRLPLMSPPIAHGLPFSTR